MSMQSRLTHISALAGAILLHLSVILLAHKLSQQKTEDLSFASLATSGGAMSVNLVEISLDNLEQSFSGTTDVIDEKISDLDSVEARDQQESNEADEEPTEIEEEPVEEFIERPVDADIEEADDEPDQVADELVDVVEDNLEAEETASPPMKLTKTPPQKEPTPKPPVLTTPQKNHSKSSSVLLNPPVPPVRHHVKLHQLWVKTLRAKSAVM